jgi:hypothetical protein
MSSDNLNVISDYDEQDFLDSDSAEYYEFDDSEDVYVGMSDDFDRISRIGSDWTVSTILDLIQKEKINLNPKFQRRDAWSSTMKSKFIESLILGVPVPSILFAEVISRRGTYQVIDGKQRLLSLLQFFTGSLKRNLEEDEIKGFRLRGLKILTKLNGFSIKDIEEHDGELDYFSLLENAPITSVALRNVENEEILYEVFRRLNTGSQKLSTQELRQSLYPGDFIDYIDELSSDHNIIRDLLNIKRKDTRMRDNELFIRYFSVKFRLSHYDNSVSKFLDQTAVYLNDNYEQLEGKILEYTEELDNAVSFVVKHFSDKYAFRLIGLDRKNLPFNRVLFELFTYFFSIKQIRIFIDENGISIKDIYYKMLEDENFCVSITENTHQTTNFKYRFQKLSDMLKDFGYGE